MSILTDIKAALEAVDAARKTLAKSLPLSEVSYLEREEALYSALETYHKLFTEDTIAALIAVAERGARNSVCVCGKVWRYENHHHADDCPLASLVKEADDE